MTNKSKKFFWGASTASHQVEGKTHNQWSVWELANAKRMSKRSNVMPSWLCGRQSNKPTNFEPSNFVSGDGVDHYNRYQEDFDILQKLNLNAFRFSIEWSRIEPKEGAFDPQAIAYYKRYIAELKKRDIEPFLTIWHWTMPVWFTNKGGFEKSANIKYFTRYVNKLAEELLVDVDYVITLNEPNIYLGMSYAVGGWPPQKTNKFLAFKVYHNLIKAHKQSYAIIKSKHPNCHVSVSQNLVNIKPMQGGLRWLDPVAAKVSLYAWNWWWLNRVKGQLDFMAVNYYYTLYIKNFRLADAAEPYSDIGWHMEPSDILSVLGMVAKRYPGKDIVITENGLADASDKDRKWWLQETMQALDRAKSQGMPVKGYLHWSLLDNFEWDSGWWTKFGLVEVDRKTMKRIIRPSAKWWASNDK